ncbi:MAG TPA: WYL domain-containing protein [Gemmatimonadales bacterium]|nr:WYL domain-containing protein [Gemmatimonadales bacterium]
MSSRPRHTAAPKLQRWIDLLAALLRRHSAASLDELVADVPAYGGYQSEHGATRESARRMFERDKDELRSFGVPIQTLPGEDGEPAGYRLRREHFYLPYLAVLRDGRPTRPRRVDRYGYKTLQELTFEPDELEAVVNAAHRVRALGDPGLAALAASALRKLAFDLPIDVSVGQEPTAGAIEEPPPALRTREAPPAGPREPPLVAAMASYVPPRTPPREDVLQALDEALRRRKFVAVTYHAIGTGTISERRLAPYGLFFLNQHWYLAAREGDGGPVKNFRVSRIASARMNPSHPGTPDFAIPAGFNLREHARSRQAWELGDGAALTAVVAFHGASGAAHAARRLGEAVEGEPDRRRFSVRRLDTFARWLLSFGGEVTPVSPPELVAAYRQLAREALVAHGGR